MDHVQAVLPWPPLPVKLSLGPSVRHPGPFMLQQSQRTSAARHPPLTPASAPLFPGPFPLPQYCPTSLCPEIPSIVWKIQYKGQILQETIPEPKIVLRASPLGPCEKLLLQVSLKYPSPPFICSFFKGKNWVFSFDLFA